MKKILLFLILLCAWGSLLTAQYTYMPFTSPVDSLIRPNNATAYTTGDAVTDSLSTSNKILVFSMTGTSAYSGEITGIYVMSDSSNAKSLRLHVYVDSVGIERTADNSAITFSSANGRFARKIGYVDVLISGNTAASGGYGQATFAGLPFRLTSARAFYVIPEVLAAFTPKAKEKFIFGVFGYVR